VNYPLALLLTLTIEAPVYVPALVRGLGWDPWAAVGAAVGINLITHPLVWLILPSGGRAYWTLLPVVEVGAWLVEFALLAVVARRRYAMLLMTALLANAASLTVGTALAWVSGQ
jgi:hypothetical protein